MVSRATSTRFPVRTRECRALDTRRIDHEARRIVAVIHASSKLQQLRNRIVAIELALARIEHPRADPT